MGVFDGPRAPFGHSRTAAGPVAAALDNVDPNNAKRYYLVVIQSFSTTETERVWRRVRAARLGPDLQRIAHRKLLMLDAAELLNDLRVPPGNRLEQLRGDRAGQHSIRINDQYRICFVWSDQGPGDVEITDYH